jgi:hypothetical protein
MTPALAGTVAGLLHVVSGPDHLVAVAPLAIRRPALGARVGLAWGLGHATGVLVLGLLGVAARSVLPVNKLSSWSEVLVGGALIGIGFWALWQSRKMVLHRHAHAHHEQDGEVAALAHEHLHVHAQQPPEQRAAHQHDDRVKPSHDHRARGAYAIGILHGAAGTGHLLGVVPALALRPAASLVYLSAYGIAAVSAMTGFGAALGLIGHRISPRLLSHLMRICGGLAIGLGVYWAVSGWP